jgi:hypothetical protein
MPRLERRKSLSAQSGEREGPSAQRWEGEVCFRGRIAFAIDTHLTRSLRSRPLPPQAGGEGLADHVAQCRYSRRARRPSRKGSGRREAQARTRAVAFGIAMTSLRRRSRKLSVSALSGERSSSQ